MVNSWRSIDMVLVIVGTVVLLVFGPPVGITLSTQGGELNSGVLEIAIFLVCLSIVVILMGTLPNRREIMHFVSSRISYQRHNHHQAQSNN